MISGSGVGPSYVGPGDIHPNSARVPGEQEQRAPPMRYERGDMHDLGDNGTGTTETAEVGASTEIEGAVEATGAITGIVATLGADGALEESARRRAKATWRRRSIASAHGQKVTHAEHLKAESTANKRLTTTGHEVVAANQEAGNALQTTRRLRADMDFAC
jgi:hypothetical protein